MTATAHLDNLGAPKAEESRGAALPEQKRKETAKKTAKTRWKTAGQCSGTLHNILAFGRLPAIAARGQGLRCNYNMMPTCLKAFAYVIGMLSAEEGIGLQLRRRQPDAL